jgi:hypothetical protein
MEKKAGPNLPGNLMREVYIISDNIVSPLGVYTTENFTALKNGFSGIKQHHNTAISPVLFLLRSLTKISISCTQPLIMLTRGLSS